MLSVIAEARFSEIPLNPVKSLATAPATVGLSVSLRKPVNSLPAASEIEGAPDTNLPAALMIVSDIEDAMFPDAVLNPVKTLPIESAIVGLSVSARNPWKILDMASEIGRASDMALPFSLLRASEIAAARFS